MSIFDFFKKNRIEANADDLNEAVNSIKVAIFNQLYLALKDKYSKQEYDVGVFAAAVTNWLFLQSSSKKNARDFYNENQQLVEMEASLLKSYFPNDEAFLVKVYSTAFHWSNAIHSEDVIRNFQQNQDCIDKLKKWGILKPQKELASYGNFINDFSSFYSKYGAPNEG